MNKSSFALSHRAELFSGVVALKLSIVKHAKDHLQDAVCRAPTMKTRAVLETLVQAQANIEKSLAAFLEACKEMETAPHITTKKEEPTP